MSCTANAIGIFSRKVDKQPPLEQQVMKGKRSIVIKDMREDCKDPIVSPNRSKEEFSREATFAASSPTKPHQIKDLEKEIEEFNATQDALLKEYYNKRSLLIDAWRKPERQLTVHDSR
jgi:predicted GTPase